MLHFLRRSFYIYSSTKNRKIELKSILIFSFVFLLGESVLGQNLISNPSFEEHTELPEDLLELNDYCTNWYPVRSTPDYFKGEHLTAEIRKRYQLGDNQKAKTGTAYAGFLNTETMANLMKKSMMKDSLYCIKAWVRLRQAVPGWETQMHPIKDFRIGFNLKEGKLRLMIGM